MSKRFLLEIFYNARGVCTGLLLCANLLFFSCLILPVALLARIAPHALSKRLMPIALQLPIYWMHTNRHILQQGNKHKWSFLGIGDLNPQTSYLLICNHASWIDIPILGAVFSGKIPLLKFFMKKSLVWQLPIAGINCYLLGYPIVSRHSAASIRKRPHRKTRDIEATQNACRFFKDYPCTLINFVEGTRFTTAKSKQQRSPYQHLLKPKATGLSIALKEMQGQATDIVDATLFYSAQKKTLWHFLCGKYTKIQVHYQLRSINTVPQGDYQADRTFRKTFQKWLNTLWEEKDQFLKKLHAHDTHNSTSDT